MAGNVSPKRPEMTARQLSSSSFAGTFEVARSKLSELGLKEPEDLDSDDTLAPGSPIPSTDSDESAGIYSTSESDDLPESPITPLTDPTTPVAEPDVADNFAFAFDIDGVLIRGGRPIPEAIEAMKVLNGENEFGITV